MSSSGAGEGNGRSRSEEVAWVHKEQLYDELIARQKNENISLRKFAQEKGLDGNRFKSWFHSVRKRRESGGPAPDAGRVRNRRPRYQQVEREVVQWMDEHDDPAKIRPAGIKQKGLEVAARLGEADFKASDTWVRAMKRRYQRQHSSGQGASSSDMVNLLGLSDLTASLHALSSSGPPSESLVQQVIEHHISPIIKAIHDNINAINDKETDIMTQSGDVMTDLLDKMEPKIAVLDDKFQATKDAYDRLCGIVMGMVEGGGLGDALDEFAQCFCSNASPHIPTEVQRSIWEAVAAGVTELFCSAAVPSGNPAVDASGRQSEPSQPSSARNTTSMAPSVAERTERRSDAFKIQRTDNRSHRASAPSDLLSRSSVKASSVASSHHTVDAMAESVDSDRDTYCESDMLADGESASGLQLIEPPGKTTDKTFSIEASITDGKLTNETAVSVMQRRAIEIVKAFLQRHYKLSSPPLADLKCVRDGQRISGKLRVSLTGAEMGGRDVSSMRNHLSDELRQHHIDIKRMQEAAG
ncbi:unnamed protein product [Vitrella brassicaformis CCMP3155]|uniref:HTH CENPB-type domain-containing protein n=3 Tax=Vitrella brassicaformis TaxID=1169539 RepID=A0A0G4ES05_VITBC|nr:unnamed protein product [Vitrella brassicaformis CCMP3155]|mmetsp:Transcript_28175/g.81141  ORF Transcript_28175/g.81141 Transcript_28175/m.81141 type:complete len:526 (+) Transcript_28175:134-1711(+)|eukprot:CEM00834.1 unnamed protein product [Vitrella brassicaformis CCMP3155]